MSADILRLHHEGLSESAIASALGISVAKVRRALVDAGIAKAAHQTRASMRGENLGDPNRADKLLRRF